MVNLRGAMRGLGAGLVQTGQMQYEMQREQERDQRIADRQMALERLQSQLREETDIRSDKRDAFREGERDQELLARRKGELEIQRPHEEAEDERTERREERRDQRQAQRESQRDSRDVVHSFRRMVDGVPHEIVIYGDGRERDLGETQGAAGLSEDRVVDRYTNEDRRRVTVYASGERVISPDRVQDSGEEDEEDLLGLDEDPSPGAAIGRDTPRIAGTLTARRPASDSGGTGSRRPATYPDARQGADGKWYVTRNGRHFRVEE